MRDYGLIFRHLSSTIMCLDLQGLVVSFLGDDTSKYGLDTYDFDQVSNTNLTLPANLSLVSSIHS